MSKQYPNSPIVVDTTKAANQVGIRGSWLEELQSPIINGSAKNGR